MKRPQNSHKNKNMTQRQPEYNGSKKTKKNEITLLISKSQDQDRFGPTSERRGSVPDRHDTPIELEPTRIRAFITVVCCVSCAAAINSSIRNRHLRLERPHQVTTAQPIPPHHRLGSHVDCLHRPMSFSGPYVHCASITSAARNSETRLDGTHRPYTQ